MSPRILAAVPLAALLLANPLRAQGGPSTVKRTDTVFSAGLQLQF